MNHGNPPGSNDDAAQPRTDALQFTPTIIIAIDPFGKQVARRLASLLRANASDRSSDASQALRERVAFIEVAEATDQATSLAPAQVNAVRLEYSADLWRLDQAYVPPSFVPGPTGEQLHTVFAGAVRQVLSYVDARETLRESGLAIRPSMLQVFVVGSLFSDDMERNLDALMGQYLLGALGAPTVDQSTVADAARTSAMNAVAHQVEAKLRSLEQIARITRAWAKDAAAMSGVLRGGFLVMPLPDNAGVARELVGRYGSLIGQLLERPLGHLAGIVMPADAAHAGEHPGRQRSQAIITALRESTHSAYDEPLLQFLSLHQTYDESTAHYGSEQLSRAVAGAIYGLVMSELFDTDTGRFQLGLQEISATPYDRLITIAASRAAFPKADLLDYAALQYGAYLVGRLMPQRAPNQEQAERLRDWIGSELKLVDLRQTIGASDAGAVAQRVAARRAHMIRQTRPPDLRRLIALPRFNPFEPWARLVRRAFDQIEELHQVLIAIQPALATQAQVIGQIQQHLPRVPDAAALAAALGAVGVNTVFAAGAGPIPLSTTPRSAVAAPEVRQRAAADVAVLREWYEWRQRMQAYFVEEAEDVKWRAERLNTMVNDHFWGQIPEPLHDDRAGDAQHIAVVPTILSVVGHEIAAMTMAITVPGPRGAEAERMRRETFAALPRLQSDARSQLRQRIEPMYLLLLMLVVGTIASYGLFALPPDAPRVVRDLVNQILVIWQVPEWNINLQVPMAVVYGAIPSLVLGVIGGIASIVQSVRIWRLLRRYASDVRRIYQSYLADDERCGLLTIPAYLHTMAEYLRLEHTAHQRVADASIANLEGRAQGIASHGFRDLTEYSPIRGPGVMTVYETYLRRRFAEWAASDLEGLRRLAGRATAQTPYSPEVYEHRFANKAPDRFNRIIVGDLDAALGPPHDGSIRQLAYEPVGRALDVYIRAELTHRLIEYAPELTGESTPLLLQLAVREQQLTYEQRYLISRIEAVRRQPEFRDAQPVATIDAEMIMYMRLVSRVWPRLFDEAGIRLTSDAP
jgi:hypothetical protein